MKVHSFGCSFTFGTDLADADNDLPKPQASKCTWPALIARQRDADYVTHAYGGCGNLQILDQILNNLFLCPVPDHPLLWIVNWTYIDRFDHLQSAGTPDQEWHTIRPDTRSSAAKMYYKNLHSQMQDKYHTLMCVFTAITMLQKHQIPFFMTCIDPLLFEREFHCTRPIMRLQDQIRPYIFDFEGTDFLAWSKKNGFKISAGHHPLEDAHRAAADLLSPIVTRILANPIP